MFTGCSIQNFLFVPKPAQDPERQTGEQRTALEPPAAEDSAAGGGEAAADRPGCGEGRGQCHHTQVTEAGGEAAEGAERVPGIEH